ncbi:MAG: hypothetical protein ABSB33_10455 [Tepidisphaeraceae bacterium]|jgi:hypothetical protein
MVAKWINGAVVVLLLARSAAAQWKPPADRKFSEDQLKVFLDTQKDWLAENAEILHDISTAQTEAARLAAAGDLDKRCQACLARHHISREEFEWISQQALAAWGALTYFDQAFKSAGDQIESQTKDNSAKLADAQSRLTIHQKAQADGVRVMTAADRDEAINSAKEDQQSALDEAKQRGDDAAAAEAEAKQHNADAKAADELASHPPSDVSADDRGAYIDNKKNEAQTARDAAKDALSREDDARKSQAGAEARAGAAARKAAHPEVPVTDDEKASVKADNDAAVTAAQSDIADCQQRSVQLAAAARQLKASARQMSQDVPEENMAIMRKYSERYHDQLSNALGSGAATQPEH